MDMGSKYKWVGVNTALSVNSTNNDINLKVTLVKLMGQDQDDVEIAYGIVPVN